MFTPTQIFVGVNIFKKGTRDVTRPFFVLVTGKGGGGDSPLQLLHSCSSAAAKTVGAAPPTPSCLPTSISIRLPPSREDAAVLLLMVEGCCCFKFYMILVLLFSFLLCLLMYTIGVFVLLNPYFHRFVP